jgi:hypothetical protein
MLADGGLSALWPEATHCGHSGSHENTTGNLPESLLATAIIERRNPGIDG